jgi:hypothetical protein
MNCIATCHKGKKEFDDGCQNCEQWIKDEANQKKLLKRAETIVLECLAEDVRCRNDDLWLILKVWQKKQHIDIFIPFEQLHEMFSAETITRVRRKIQNDYKRYTPTLESVIIRRKQREKFMRKEMRNRSRSSLFSFLDGDD